MATSKLKSATLVAILLVLLFILGNSLLSGAVSANLTEFVFGEITEEVKIVVRKTAHLLEFFALGFVVARISKSRLLAAMIGLNVAVMDEYIQTFIPGRCGAWGDVLIDLAGVLLAVCLFSLDTDRL